MTTLSEERAEQQRWKAVQLQPSPVHDRLLENEFLPQDQQRGGAAQSLLSTLRFCGRFVPYYQERFDFSGTGKAAPRPFRILETLPVLTKFDVQKNETALRATQIPPNAGGKIWKLSSGTTGKPVRVLHTRLSLAMFQQLKQREYRWFRFDPAGKLATLRLFSSATDTGQFERRDRWSRAFNFATGPFVGFAVTNPTEAQIAWLRDERPDYLMAYSETLELVALTAGEQNPCDSLKGLLAISEQLTPHMRAHVEGSFGLPVQQNYGLNEIGLIACRCAAGRYHVHREICFVEILNEDGTPAKPGETGRIVATSLLNPAMPLLRYDTGDLAKAVEGPCPCGRTLPSFGEIVGRYSRIAYLPENTLGLVGALRSAIEELPHSLIRDLREFQIHQYRDNSFEIRLDIRAPLGPEFEEGIRAAWVAASKGNPFPLSFVKVDMIAPSPSGKKQVFTSDFMGDPGANRQIGN